MTRLRLPYRREHRKMVVEFLPPSAPEGSVPLKMHVTVSFHAPAMATVPIALEVFARGGGKVKVGTERDFLLDDVATVLSLLLQMGMRPARIRRALGEDAAVQGRPLTFLAALVDAVIAAERAYHEELGLAAPSQTNTDAAPGPRHCAVIEGPCDRRCAPATEEVCARLRGCE